MVPRVQQAKAEALDGYEGSLVPKGGMVLEARWVRKMRVVMDGFVVLVAAGVGTLEGVGGVDGGWDTFLGS